MPADGAVDTSVPPSGAVNAPPALHVETDRDRARILELGWDTEGGSRSRENLLRAPVELRLRRNGTWQAVADLPSRSAPGASGGTEYRISVADGAVLVWAVRPQDGGLEMWFGCEGKQPWEGALELAFSFDPRVTPTTVLSSSWTDEGHFALPAVVSAPDHGQVWLSVEPAKEVKGRLEGNRAEQTVQVTLELSLSPGNQQIKLLLTPVRLAAPVGLRDVALWQQARRGWFGALQATSAWGQQTNPFSAPAGMLGNNVISDPASCSLWFYADQAFWVPELAEGVDAMAMVRRTLDWWLDEKVLPDGEVICYWDKKDFLDANASLLIAAWDYVEATGDMTWLTHRIERLEFVADYLVRRDVDGDGLVEAVQSGNANTLQEPMRSCAWWDALNCGHKDGYTNALIYRAWRCLADLEARLDRKDAKDRYAECARRLKSVYMDVLFNPETGWLGWWRSADGQLHDYASPVVNGLAIEYGLVPPEQGKIILALIRDKMAEAGFSRFELGVPPMLVPVPRSDYLQPDAAGCPKREDGTDTFGYYMNGGITAGQVLHFLAAHYVVGDPEPADRILRAMLERLTRGGFQNGVINAYPKGMDWTTWDGEPAGYEGYLADSFRFLQAVLLRQSEFRNRLYRPLSGGITNE
ncbi:MAG: hypothetical protein HYZ00_13875 [Candidatus Hydrogenedentes bacterium]|nr:hypothetical protein [Candidatus Hydrogenedentota bacterium]